MQLMVFVYVYIVVCMYVHKCTYKWPACVLVYVYKGNEAELWGREFL